MAIKLRELTGEEKYPFGDRPLTAWLAYRSSP